MHDTPEFRTEFKKLTPQLIDSLPKVLLHSTAPIASLSQETLVYAEHVVDFADLDEAIAQASASEFTVALVVRCHSVAEIDTLVADPTGLVVGALSDDLTVAAAARERYFPCVVDAPLTDQLDTATPRLTHALELFDDFGIDTEGEILPGRRAAWVRDRGMALLCDPLADLDAGDIDALADHPLELLRSLGFNAVCANLDTALLAQLVEQLELTIEDIFELTTAALDAAFLASPLRAKLLDEQLLPAFAPFIADGEASTTGEAAAEHEEPEDLDVAALDPILLEQFGIDPDDLRK